MLKDNCPCIICKNFRKLSKTNSILSMFMLILFINEQDNGVEYQMYDIIRALHK